MSTTPAPTCGICDRPGQPTRKLYVQIPGGFQPVAICTDCLSRMEYHDPKEKPAPEGAGSPAGASGHSSPG